MKLKLKSEYTEKLEPWALGFWWNQDNEETQRKKWWTQNHYNSRVFLQLVNSDKFTIHFSLYLFLSSFWRNEKRLQFKSSCIPCEMNWCALIKKWRWKKTSLGCLFNLISVHRSAIFSAGWFFSLSRFALSFRLLFFSLNWLTICNARHLRICS